MELALVYSLGMMGHLISSESMEATLETGLEIVIAGNNDFYSQRNEVRDHIFALEERGRKKKKKTKIC